MKHLLALTKITAKLFIAANLFAPVIVFAQAQSLALTITPPLFQVNLSPGETWSSFIKAVNSNPYELPLFASIANFTSEGEGGQASLSFLDAGDLDVHSAAGWIDIEDGPHNASGGSSIEIPFSINVPADAPPGGHYVAIMIGAHPVDIDEQGAVVGVSSFITSLIFIRVEGDVIESGAIREFSSDKNFYEKPEADFILRFENSGNVHVRPQGEIVICNMWGKMRGQVGVNQGLSFGNVLPGTVRKFEFKWKGDGNIFEIGRFSAVATVNFGKDAKQNRTATTYFWVVPVIPVLSIGGGLIFFILLFTWFVKRYVKKALQIEYRKTGQFLPESTTSDGTSRTEKSPVPKFSWPALYEPVREGVLDIRKLNSRQAFQVTKAKEEDRYILGERTSLSFGEFLKKYAIFFVFLWFLVAFGALIWLYFDNVLLPSREAEFILKNKL